MNFEDDLMTRQADANARAAAAGLCWMHNLGEQPQAEYLMELQNGNVVPLCAMCCADWRLVAMVTEPSMQPVSITSIPLGRSAA